MTGRNQPDDPGREPDDTAEFDVIRYSPMTWMATATLATTGGRFRPLVWMGGSP